MHMIKKNALLWLSLLLPVAVWAAAPANDNFSGAVELTGSTPSGALIDNIAEATLETNEPANHYAQSVWYAWEAPDNLMIRFTVKHTMPIGTAIDSTNVPLIHVYYGTSLTTLCAVVGGYDNYSFDQYYADTAKTTPSTTTPDSATSYVTFLAVKGVKYRIAIDFGTAKLSTPITGSIELLPAISAVFGAGTTVIGPATPSSAVPVNDNFANASELKLTDGQTTTLIGYPTSATRESTERTNNGYRTLWYTYTPAQNGLLHIDVSGSSSYTYMVVYRGTVIDKLNTVGVVTGGAVSVPVEGGKQYYVASGNGYNSNYYNSYIRLSFDPSGLSPSTGIVFPDTTNVITPANDSFAKAKELTLDTTTHTVTAIGALYDATVEAYQPNGYQTLWYKWTPTAADKEAARAKGTAANSPKTYDISVRPAGTDQTLSVFTGTSLSSLTYVGTMTKGCCTFEPVVGTTYYIMVWAYSNGQGSWTYLDIAPSNPTTPTTDPVITNANMNAVSVRGYCRFDGTTLTKDNLIPGFVVTGTTPQWVIIRALGPGLSSALPDSYMANPQLELYKQGKTPTLLASNDDWSYGLETADRNQLITDMAHVGMQPLVQGSYDAVIVRLLDPGVYTAVASASTVVTDAVATAIAAATDDATKLAAGNPARGTILVEVYILGASRTTVTPN